MDMDNPMNQDGQLRYSVHVIVDGADESPVDADFEYIDDAEEAMGKLVDTYLPDDSVMDVEIAIYDNFACENVELWNKMDEEEFFEELKAMSED